MQPARGEITLLLAKWKDGEPSAFQELMPLVYPHLREVAAAYIRRERNPDVLQGTALVHELYHAPAEPEEGRVGEIAGHFYAFAAKVMRMILIDHAREMQTQTRGGDLDRVPLNDDLAWVNIDGPELAGPGPRPGRTWAVGCREGPTRGAALLSGLHGRGDGGPDACSRSTVDRDLKFIRSWLYRPSHPDRTEECPEG